MVLKLQDPHGMQHERPGLTHAIHLEVRLLPEHHRPPPNHPIYDTMQLTKVHIQFSGRYWGFHRTSSFFYRKCPIAFDGLSLISEKKSSSW
jgi:hypothetical protein